MPEANYFELRPQFLTVEQANSSDHFYAPVEQDAVPIGLQIWVDGTQLEEGIAIDFLAVLSSTIKPVRSFQKASWESFIFTCGCGHSSCAGIDEGVKESHEGPYVVWRANLPLVAKRRGTENPWGQETTFRFLKSQMIEQCRFFVATARRESGGKLSRVRLPIHNESLHFLLRKSRYNWARRCSVVSTIVDASNFGTDNR
jgi:hypothetical protein